MYCKDCCFNIIGTFLHCGHSVKQLEQQKLKIVQVFIVHYYKSQFFTNHCDTKAIKHTKARYNRKTVHFKLVWYHFMWDCITPPKCWIDYFCGRAWHVVYHFFHTSVWKVLLLWSAMLFRNDYIVTLFIICGLSFSHVPLSLKVACRKSYFHTADSDREHPDGFR